MGSSVDFPVSCAPSFSVSSGTMTNVHPTACVSALSHTSKHTDRNSLSD